MPTQTEEWRDCPQTWRFLTRVLEETLKIFASHSRDPERGVIAAVFPPWGWLDRRPMGRRRREVIPDRLVGYYGPMGSGWGTGQREQSPTMTLDGFPSRTHGAFGSLLLVWER